MTKFCDYCGENEAKLDIKTLIKRCGPCDIRVQEIEATLKRKSTSLLYQLHMHIKNFVRRIRQLSARLNLRSYYNKTQRDLVATAKKLKGRHSAVQIELVYDNENAKSAVWRLKGRSY